MVALPGGPRPASAPRSATKTVLDTFACALCWLMQVVIALLTFVLSAAGVMITDSCGPTADCGDSAWIGRAMGLALFSGAALTIASVATCTVLLVRQRLAFPVAIGFLLTQGALLVVAMMMVEQAGVR